MLDFSLNKEKRLSSEEEQSKELMQLGFNPEELDLRDYFTKSEELRIKLEEYGSIWVMGGNVFVL